MGDLHTANPTCNARVLDFAETIKAAGDFDSAWRAYNAAMGRLGFSSCTYAFWVGREAEGDADDIKVISSHPPDWMRRYEAHGYANHDPTVKHCILYDGEPILWHRMQNPAIRTAFSTRFEQLAAAAGLGLGVTFPLRDANLSSIGGIGLAANGMGAQELETLVAERRDELWTMANMFHALAQSPPALRQIFPLSDRERECLLWASAGLSTKETAHRIGLADKTVEHHVKRACVRLNARNRTHAVSRAILFGLIEP